MLVPVLSKVVFGKQWSNQPPTPLLVQCPTPDSILGIQLGKYPPQDFITKLGKIRGYRR
ncbi:hypothetical protein PIB30_107310, partial [Stylosanthes scabra]|nr:hypothetical protein [Stylosanthes scabra]